MHDPAPVGGPLDTRDPNTGQPKQQRRTVIHARDLSRLLLRNSQTSRGHGPPTLRHADEVRNRDFARSRSKSQVNQLRPAPLRAGVAACGT